MMSIFLAYLALFLAISADHADAGYYCICNDGLSDEIYQMNIDYACQNGADCIPIIENSPCFQPTTVKDRCNFAVNSYYQRNGQVQWSCSFSNTTTLTQAAPPATSECANPSPSSPRDVDPPKRQQVIHFSLSIKITLATGSVVILIVIGLLKLFKMYRRTQLSEGESHQEEAANHHNGLGRIETNVVDSPSTKLDIEG